MLTIYNREEHTSHSPHWQCTQAGRPSLTTAVEDMPETTEPAQ